MKEGMAYVNKIYMSNAWGERRKETIREHIWEK